MINWEAIILVLLSTIGYAFFSAERDRISFRPDYTLFPRWNWWVKKNTNRTFLTKYVLSFLADGWHFCKSAEVFFYALSAAYILNSVAALILIYIVFGIYFEFFYQFFYIWMKNIFTWLINFTRKNRVNK